MRSMARTELRPHVDLHVHFTTHSRFPPTLYANAPRERSTRTLHANASSQSHQSDLNRRPHHYE
jgi:hypothetical protein